MVHKLGRPLVLIAIIVAIPLLLLQGVWLAMQSTPLTLALILGTTLIGMALLLMLALRTLGGIQQHQEPALDKSTAQPGSAVTGGAPVARSAATVAGAV